MRYRSSSEDDLTSSAPAAAREHDRGSVAASERMQRIQAASAGLSWDELLGPDNGPPINHEPPHRPPAHAPPPPPRPSGAEPPAPRGSAAHVAPDYAMAHAPSGLGTASPGEPLRHIDAIRRSFAGTPDRHTTAHDADEHDADSVAD